MTLTTRAQRTSKESDKNAIRPFHVNFPESELAELRRRINTTKWPERETVTVVREGRVEPFLDSRPTKSSPRHTGVALHWRATPFQRFLIRAIAISEGNHNVGNFSVYSP